MKRVVGLLVPVVFAVLATLNNGCGGGSGKAEINTQRIQELKPGEAKDIRDSMFPKKK